MTGEKRPVATDTDIVSWYLSHVCDTITPLDAWTRLGVYRLAARINDLRNEGWVIETKRIKCRSRTRHRASKWLQGIPLEVKPKTYQVTVYRLISKPTTTIQGELL